MAAHAQRKTFNNIIMEESMAERISVAKIQTAVGKAVQDALNEKVLHHGPIICGFVAPDALSVSEAQKIADETAHAVGGGAQAVVEKVSAGTEAGRAAVVPGRVIICGIRIDPNSLR
jgi:hypothetical protein